MTQIPSGAGRGQLKDHLALRLGVLRGLSDFFHRLVGPDGALVCSRHRVEHTGKNVYAALIHHACYRYTREDFYLDRARQQALRTVDMLGQDPESGVAVFLPGRVDPANASTNAIDGGACADVLSTLLASDPDIFDSREQERVHEAVERHVEEYLRHAAREKPIPAQRLWAGTGVASAARLFGRKDWEEDVLAGCSQAIDEMSEAGVAPYIPQTSEHCTHPGLSDSSNFYHSRVPGFLLYIYQTLEKEIDDRTSSVIEASLDALLAFRNGLGHKVIHNEAKHWYWESEYEVASHPFDAFALQVGSEVLSQPQLAVEAGWVVEEWIAHLNPLDGGVLSHHGRGVNFQCPVFWSAHGAWIARIMDRVDVRSRERDLRDIDLAMDGIVHVERPGYTAVLRGKRKPHSHLFGCSVGGGALQSLVFRQGEGDGRPHEQIALERHQLLRQGSYLFRPVRGAGRLRRLLTLFQKEKGDLRFRGAMARVEWKAGRFFGALVYLWRHLIVRLWNDAAPWCAAHLDLETSHSWEGDTLVFQGTLADRDGKSLEGAVTERRYTFGPDEVEFVDTLSVEGLHGELRYRIPLHLCDVHLEGEGADCTMRAGEGSATLKGEKARITLSGKWVPGN